jgi:hypothetical protein
MEEWPGFHQSVFRRDCTWRIYHYIFGKNNTFKFGFSFISGGPSFVRQKCSFCRGLSIVATSKPRGKRSGELSHTAFVWTCEYVKHSEVGGVTDGKYWVEANLTRGHIMSKKDPNLRVLSDIMPTMEGGPTREMLGSRDPLEFLSPNDWFERGHDIAGWEQNRPTGWSSLSPDLWYPTLESDCYLREPPRVAASVAVEELRKARLKRQASTHIFVYPRLIFLFTPD